MNIVRSIASHSLSVCEAVAKSFSDSLVTTFDYLLGEKKDMYEAEFGNLAEVASPSGDGIVLNGTDRLYSLEDGYRNVLVAGSSGAGKTAAFVIPNLIRLKNSSLIVHDPPGQVYDVCAPYRRELGNNVMVLDFSNPCSSVCINPIDFIGSPSDINKLAMQLVRATMGSGAQDKFWELSAIKLLSLFIGILLEQDKKYRHLASVRAMLIDFEGEPEKIDRLFAKAKSPQLYSEYRSLVKSNEKVLSSICMTAQAALQLWASENVCMVTSRTTLDMEAFRRGGACLFIKNATYDANYYRPLMSIIIDSMMASLMSRMPKKHDSDVVIILDEAATLRLPSLDQALSNNRKYRICFCILLQSVHQLESFGAAAASNTVANCYSKLYLDADMETAAQLERLLGTRTIRNEAGKDLRMPLMPANAIRQMKKSEAILICGSHPPFLVNVTPYYEQPFMRRALGTPQPQHKTAQSLTNTSIDIPIIPLK